MVLAWRNHPAVRGFMLTQHEISLDEHRQWFARVKLDKNCAAWLCSIQFS